MIVVYCFYPGDQELALKNANWIHELGGCKGHELLGAWDPRCHPELVEEIRQSLEKSFDKLHKCPAHAAIDGWPEGANYFFRIITNWLQDKGQWPYFFWLEPDAIPLVPGWLDKLEDEYKRAGKPFMGDRVEVMDIPLHMSGVGIYQNPIYMLAGEAYRAYDTAWDMAAKDQIVPHTHFTNLIEHAWKHPTFKDEYELNTQIAKETILFHSSKDGSLIDLLRQKAAPGRDQNSVPTEPTSGVHPSREEIGTRAAQPIYDIFIRTYPGDYEWLKYCLKSIDKYVTGFRKIWIVSPAGPPSMITPVEFTWKQMNDETEDGYLAQQITKLYADVISDYQADFILHVDSDVIFTRPTKPQDFFYAPTDDSEQIPSGKLIWYYTPYEAIQTPWQPIMEKFMGFTMPYEFMRRLPMMLPRWLYPKMREFCHMLHGMIVSEYIRMQPMRAFSEFNALGCYAYFHHPDSFHWQSTQEEGMMPAPFARQFHSWSGLTPEVKTEIESILNAGNISPYHLQKEMVSGQQAEALSGTEKIQSQKESMVPGLESKSGLRDMRGETSGMSGLSPSGREREERPGVTSGLQSSFNAADSGGNQEMRDSVRELPQKKTLGGSQLGKARPLSPQIKELPTGVWVLEGDQISDWVIQEGRLDHDQNLLPDILKHINPGDTVVDAGAFIGDHTVAYSDAVDHGRVFAFEPNPVAFTCLKHNTKDCYNIGYINCALGDADETVPLSGNNGNWGGAYIGDHMKITDVTVRPLDSFPFIKSAPRVDFIKIDTEGYELKVLNGAVNTIERFHPKMVIEINRDALYRQKSTPDKIFGWLVQHGYEWTIIQNNCLRNDPMYDILCLPKQPPENHKADSSAHTPESSPVAPISTRDMVRTLVRQLKAIAEKSPLDRGMVMQHLVINGLKKPNKAAHRKRKQTAKKLPF